MSVPYRATRSLASNEFRDVRRWMAMNHCKWDPQVGDASTLVPFALRMSASKWHTLADLAESLAAEARAAQRELSTRVDLHRALGLPRWMRGAFDHVSVDRPQVMRFDFHWTRDGRWQISEVNADVPGGFVENRAYRPRYF